MSVRSVLKFCIPVSVIVGWCVVSGPFGAAAAVPTVSAAAVTPSAWGAPYELKGGSAFSTTLEPTAISCPGVGACVVGGSYDPRNPGYSEHAGLAQERNGSWETAVAIPGIESLSQGFPARVDSVSCASPGNCTLAGLYVTGGADLYIHQGFVATETNWHWGKAVNVPGLVAMNKGNEAEVTSVSCAAPGYCTAGGVYAIVDPHEGPFTADGFVVTETKGVWGKAKPAPGIKITATTDAVIQSVSCSSPGNCTAGGTLANNATFSAVKGFVVTQTSGTWHAARFIANVSGITLLSCRATGDCTGAGQGTGSVCVQAGCAALVNEKNGSWGAGRAVLAKNQQTTTSAVGALSCASAGNCAIGGSWGKQAYLMTQRNGTWSVPRVVPGSVALNVGGGASVTALSCPALGFCVVGGVYLDGKGTQRGFLIAQSNGGWGTLRQVGYGGVGAISCYSTASCGVLVGKVTNTAIAFDAPAYNAVMEKAPVQNTSTALALSTASARYGHEQAVRVTVAVHARLGIPAGSVIVYTGSHTLCVIGLVTGHGSCTLAARALRVGSWPVTAYYLGLPQFRKSFSASKTLHVTS
jgi:hypothetical protein